MRTATSDQDRRPGHRDHGRHTYEIVYRVQGAMNGFADHDELFWNAIGDQWEQSIGEMNVRVSGPAGISAGRLLPGHVRVDDPVRPAQITKKGDAVFSQSNLPAFQAMSVVTAMPPGTVESTAPILDERWSLDKAFSRTPVTVGGGMGLLVLVVGGLGFVMWRRGRDVRLQGLADRSGDGRSGRRGDAAGAAVREERRRRRVRAARGPAAWTGGDADRRGGQHAGRERHDRRPRRPQVPGDRGDPQDLGARQGGLEPAPAARPGGRPPAAVRAEAARRAVRGRGPGRAVGAAEEVRRTPAEGEGRAVQRHGLAQVVPAAAGPRSPDMGDHRGSVAVDRDRDHDPARRLHEVRPARHPVRDRRGSSC
jgi:Predicted membrane protein (DUF2207).